MSFMQEVLPPSRFVLSADKLHKLGVRINNKYDLSLECFIPTVAFPAGTGDAPTDVTGKRAKHHAVGGCRKKSRR